MAKEDPEAAKGGRRRQLNVIYFVDSARTRSFAIPLGRLNVLLFLFFSVLTWAFASVFLIVWMARGEDRLATQLRSALATVFEYETRYDGVYDVAYPPAEKSGGTKPATVAAAAPVPKPVVTASSQEPDQAPVTPEPVEPAAATPESQAAEVDLPDAAPVAAAKAPVAQTPEDSGVTVSNPVLEAGGESLELRFDLTSKAGQDRAEGYVWSVAEFTTDDGKKLYIGAPSSIQVRDDGEPTFPQRSAIFGIKRFKKKIFSFPLVKDQVGTFTGVRIGVMDRTGGNKATYNVPVQIRIGKGGGEGPSGAGAENVTSPKSG